MAASREIREVKVNSPEEAWEKILLPLIEEAKERGRQRYGDQWRQDLSTSDSPEYRAWHGIQVHAMARLAQVPELVEREQYQTAYALMASAAYHLAVIVAQVEELRRLRG